MSKRKPKVEPSTDFELVPPKHTTHPSRQLSDYDLRSAVRPLELTQDKLVFLANYIRTVAGRYNDFLRDIDPNHLAALIINFAPTSYELGDWGGVVTFAPCFPGHDAMVHAYLWSPMFLRRPVLGRAIFRHAFKRWQLRRIYTLTPAPHTTANRFVESLGMTLEGRFRHAFVYNGTLVDGMYRAILAGEVE